MKDNPDKKISNAIYNKFKETNLLKDSDLDKIEQKLVTGEVTEEDWTLMAELSLDKKESGENKKGIEDKEGEECGEI